MLVFLPLFSLFPFLFTPSCSNCAACHCKLNSSLREEVVEATEGLAGWQRAFINDRSPTLLWIGGPGQTIDVVGQLEEQPRLLKRSQLADRCCWKDEQGVGASVPSQVWRRQGWQNTCDGPAFMLMSSLYRFSYAAIIKDAGWPADNTAMLHLSTTLIPERDEFCCRRLNFGVRCEHLPLISGLKWSVLFALSLLTFFFKIYVHNSFVILFYMFFRHLIFYVYSELLKSYWLLVSFILSILLFHVFSHCMWCIFNVLSEVVLNINFICLVFRIVLVGNSIKVGAVLVLLGLNPVKSGSEQRGWRSSPNNEIIGCSRLWWRW